MNSRPLKVYIAGKVSKNSVFKTHDWRDEFCSALAKASGREIINLDPTKERGTGVFDENDSRLVFGRDLYMISISDLVIVYLTDDISVGGSQEMLVAKYCKKPLIGLAPKEGKFNLSEYENYGTKVKNWIHPFVAETCDLVVATPEEAAQKLSEVTDQNFKVKDISVIDIANKYFQDVWLQKDPFLRDIK
jgi:hypothetical protein